MIEQTKQKKTFWPVGIILVMALFMTAIVSWAIFASTQTVDLVEKDYYQREVAYDQKMERLRNTQQLSAQPHISYARTEKAVVVAFPPDFNKAAVSGTITLFRPSDAALDHGVPLKLASNLTQRIEINSLADGFWICKIEWQADGKPYYFEQRFSVNNKRCKIICL